METEQNNLSISEANNQRDIQPGSREITETTTQKEKEPYERYKKKFVVEKIGIKTIPQNGKRVTQ